MRERNKNEDAFVSGINQNLARLIQDNKLQIHGDIEHFAELVRCEERERCADIIDSLVLEHPGEANKTAMQCAQAIRDLE